MSQYEGTTLESARQTRVPELSRKKIVKNGINYTLNTTESTSNICGYCVIEEIRYDKPEKIDYISKRISFNKK